MVPGPEKVVKICPRLFLHVQMRNDNKCVPNRLGIFQVPKSSHPGPIFDIFFSSLPVYGFQKILKICVVLLYGSEILSKNSTKLCFFFQKKLRYLKSRILRKFHRLLFLFYFLAFLAFFFQFHLSKFVNKICNFF